MGRNNAFLCCIVLTRSMNTETGVTIYTKVTLTELFFHMQFIYPLHPVPSQSFRAVSCLPLSFYITVEMICVELQSFTISELPGYPGRRHVWWGHYVTANYVSVSNNHN